MTVQPSLPEALFNERDLDRMYRWEGLAIENLKANSQATTGEVVYDKTDEPGEWRFTLGHVFRDHDATIWEFVAEDNAPPLGVGESMAQAIDDAVSKWRSELEHEEEGYGGPVAAVYSFNGSLTFAARTNQPENRSHSLQGTIDLEELKAVVAWYDRVNVGDADDMPTILTRWLLWAQRHLWMWEQDSLKFTTPTEEGCGKEGA